MADTTFQPRQTVIASTWLQDVNNFVYRPLVSASQLRTQPGTGPSWFQTMGYHGPGMGGAGVYYKDLSDTTTPDDGFLCFVNPVDQTRYKLQYDGEVSLLQAGAWGDGTPGANSGHDDTAALTAFFAALSPTLAGYIPGRCYNFSQQLFKVGNRIRIRTEGAMSSILNWVGAAGNTNLVVFGNGNTAAATSCTGWKLDGLGFESAVKMTGGAALLLQKFVVHNILEDCAFGVLTQNGNLYHGLWLNYVNVFYLNNVNATHCQGDGFIVNGQQDGNGGSDVFCQDGNISFCGGSGVHIAGGMGGFRSGAINSFDNSINWLVDNGVVPQGNRELFFQKTAVCDGATVAGVIIDDTIAVESPIVMDLYIASSGVNGGAGPFHGLWIKSWSNGRISLNSGEVFNNVGSGIRKDDQTTALMISSTVDLFNNTQYGISCAAPDVNIWFGGGRTTNNGTDFDTNSQCFNGTAPNPVLTASTGAIAAYTSSARCVKVGKIATYEAFVNLTNIGTASGTLQLALPIQVRGAIAVTGKDWSTGKAVIGAVNANSMLESITYADGTTCVVNGLILSMVVTTEVQ